MNGKHNTSRGREEPFSPEVLRVKLSELESDLSVLIDRAISNRDKVKRIKNANKTFVALNIQANVTGNVKVNKQEIAEMMAVYKILIASHAGLYEKIQEHLNAVVMIKSQLQKMANERQ